MLGQLSIVNGPDMCEPEKLKDTLTTSKFMTTQPSRIIEASVDSSGFIDNAITDRILCHPLESVADSTIENTACSTECGGSDARVESWVSDTKDKQIIGDIDDDDSDDEGVPIRSWYLHRAESHSELRFLYQQ